jgi:hypothetical protein
MTSALAPFTPVAAANIGFALPTNGITLYYSLFGFCFCLLFGPLLIGRTQLPEPVQEYLTFIATVIKSAGLSREERKGIYLQLLEIILHTNPKFASIDLDKIKQLHQVAMKKSLSLTSGDS